MRNIETAKTELKLKRPLQTVDWSDNVKKAKLYHNISTG